MEGARWAPSDKVVGGKCFRAEDLFSYLCVRSYMKQELGYPSVTSYPLFLSMFGETSVGALLLPQG